MKTPAFIETIFNCLPDLVFAKDSELRIVMANDALMSLYPESMQDRIIGYTTAEEYDEEEARSFLEQDRIAFRDGAATTIESVDFPSGERKTLFTQKIRFEDQNGEAFIAGVARDITEIVSNQAALKESEERYGLAVNGSSVGIWDWDQRTGDSFYSALLRSMLGIVDPDFIPSLADFNARVHADDQKHFRARLAAHLHKREPFDLECRLKRDSGAYLWTHVRGQAEWDETGNATRMAGSVDDISDRKRAEEALQRSHEQLDQYAHIASHDLKEPLRAICNHVQLLREDLEESLEPEARQRLNRVEELTRSMTQMITDMLQSSRDINSEHYELVDMNAEAAAVIEMFADSANTTIEIAKNLATVHADPVGVRQVLHNLISNAIAYNDSDLKYIEIGQAHDVARTGVSGPVFFVRDNGIGIAPRFHQAIFRMFKRLNTKDQYRSGTGAGLAFVHKIISHHGGDVWVESEMGHGSTFYFCFNTAS
ncbi:MAG: ATP-binding protein [Pseudomonadota bacterium]